MTISFPVFDIFSLRAGREAEASNVMAEQAGYERSPTRNDCSWRLKLTTRLRAWPCGALLVAAKLQGDLRPFLEQVANTPVKGRQ